MEAHSFQGLKDLLKPMLPPKSNSFSRKCLCSASLVEMEIAKKFKEDSLDSYEGSSPKMSSSSTTLPFPISLSPLGKDLPKTIDTKNPIESLVKKESKSKQKMKPGKEMVEEIVKKGPRTYLEGILIPPPISCLKHVKVGKSYTYLRFDKELDNYVLEEIKIPNRDLFHASRDNGRLRLYLDFSADDEE
ncbi:hypothetical protein L6164_008635 [Bauhinia variegata]|uniref:Uncharacterized protein n=1 Tax=Bauhinia variegata TaxID=167791 RepID=A0ACB9PHK5_BAUVA|nr:hypothetical protein L6164_008635 [Bauhinia variegata]